MWVLAGAVLTASLLGSMHCVGMCGPLAIWASGGGQQHSRVSSAMATTLYHLGRLLTYTLAGAIAGGIGSLVDVGGTALGVQLLAARIVGGFMILFGVLQLRRIIQLRPKNVATLTSKSLEPSFVTRQLIRFRPAIFKLPLAGRGLLVGLLTALLPCGWLYLFALAAAGTGSVLLGSTVMAAFWLGTVPVLVLLVASTQTLATRFRKFVPALASILLILAGGYTASGRGFASLHSLNDIQAPALFSKVSVAEYNALQQSSRPAATTGRGAGIPVSAIVDQLQSLTETPLPCCQEGDEARPPESTSETKQIASEKCSCCNENVDSNAERDANKRCDANCQCDGNSSSEPKDACCEDESALKASAQSSDSEAGQRVGQPHTR